MTTYTATYSPDDNKLRLTASTRLDAETYARVKAAGFAWAPKQEQFIAPMWTPGRADLCEELAGEIEDDDSSLAERAEERAERFEGYQERRADEAQRARDHVERITDGIPLGQPILVGHHSERHARKDAERIENGMRKAVKLWETSQYWKSRAAGALRHAKYKETPAVRHRRIKGIEADARKNEKTRAEAAAMLRVWSTLHEPGSIKRKDGAETTFMERALYVSNRSGYQSFCFPLADYPRDLPASQYEGPMSIWSALSDGVITPEQAQSLVCPRYRATIAHAERWAAHYANRLEYERAMLGESGGIAAEKFDLQPGGKVKIRGSWRVIVRVNRKDGQTLSVSLAGQSWTAGVEEITEYEAPTETAAAAVAAAKKLPPLCNYRSDGCEEMTADEWKRRAAGSDCYFTQVTKATDTHGAHRRRTRARLSGDYARVPVFLTDAKETPAPLLKPAGKTMARKIAEAASIDTSATPEEAPAPAPTLREVIAEECAPTPTDTREQIARLEARNAARVEREASAQPFQAMKDALRNGVQVVSAPQLFPTPPTLAARMVEECGIQDGETVLEPSGGTGRLIQAVIDAVDTEIVSYEINSNLCAQLSRTFPCFKLQARCRDFLTVTDGMGQFPRIIMNPPFANGADVDHVTHAARFLAPGGRLVAIMSAGVTFRDDRKTRHFRQMVERMGGTIEPLPDDTFATSGTGVRTVLVTLDAPDGDAPGALSQPTDATEEADA